VDGFGREIVVSDPEPLHVGQIASQLAGVQVPARLKVWIAYHREQTQRPARGYDDCVEGDRFTRVREAFRLLYQDDPPPFHPPQPKDPEAPDTWPRPYEDLPDDPLPAPWPVLLGTLVWDVDPQAPTQRAIREFQALGRRYVGLVGAQLVSPSPSDLLDILAATVRINAEHTRPVVITTRAAPAVGDGNLYVQTNDGAGGNRVVLDKDVLQVKKPVIAEATVGDGNGKLRVEADAGDLATLTRPASSTDPLLLTHDLAIATNDGAGGNTVLIDKDKVKAKELAVVEAATVGGGLTLEQGKDLKIQGGKLALQLVGGAIDTDDMLLFRQRGPGLPPDYNDMVLQIGDNLSGDDRLVIGPRYYQDGQLKEQVVFTNAGDGFVKRNLTVGAGANGEIRVRHVNGKDWQSDNLDHLYLNWNTGKNVEVGRSTNPSALNVTGALTAANLLGGIAFRIGAGQTPPGATGWVYYNSDGIYVDVDTSAAGFTQTPIYITSLHGQTEHWSTTGASSVYLPTATGFRIYLRWASGGGLTPTRANDNAWHVQWVGIQV
jgi:hypothetical protein